MSTNVERATPATKIRPRGDAILIRQEDPAEVTKTGIVIPQIAQERGNVGTVLDVGPGRYTNHGVLVPCECKPGETVVWDKYQGTNVSEFFTDGKKYWLVREDVITGHGTKEAA